MSYFSIPRLYLVLPDGTVPRSWQPEGEDLLFAFALIWEWCTAESMRGQELEAGPFLVLLSIHPCLWSVKDVYGASALSLHWCLLWPEEKGREVLNPWWLLLNSGELEAKYPTHGGRVNTRGQGCITLPLGPQEAAQAWVSPAVLTLFNKDLSYQHCHDFGQSPLWIILLNYGWMSAAEA